MSDHPGRGFDSRHLHVANLERSHRVPALADPARHPHRDRPVQVVNRWIVWFHRCRAVLWIVAGICAFVFGWQSSVVFVVVASIYANTVSDWAAAEAADDHRITDRLDRIEALLQPTGDTHGCTTPAQAHCCRDD